MATSLFKIKERLNSTTYGHCKEDVEWLVNYVEHLHKLMNESALSHVSYDIVRDDRDDE